LNVARLGVPMKNLSADTEFLRSVHIHASFRQPTPLLGWRFESMKSDANSNSG
jgi:hypothetical protein